MRKLWLCLAAGALITTACGSSGDDDAGGGPVSSDDGAVSTEPDTPDPDTTDDGAAPEGSDPATTDASDEGEPVSGGSFTYGMYSETTGFNLMGRGTSYADPAIYDNLLRFDDDGNVEPFVAESMETEDNVTWTMKLREGVNFHDGTPLNADAVIASIERQADPENASPRMPFTEPIESMTAIDDLTVEFVLNRAFKPFDASFAQSGGLGMIPSPTAVEKWGEEYNLHPVGVGPFVFEEWIQDDRLVLSKNEDYWQEGLPYLDELIYQPIPDTQSRQQAILNGDVDLVYMITAEQIQEAEQQPDLEVLKSFANGGEGILLNHNRPPFDDPRMREAFVSVLNLDAIAEVRYGGDRDLAGAVGFLAPSDPMYNPAKHDVYPDYDPERAKELIAEYEAEGNDSSMTFVLPNTPDRRAFGDMAGQFFRDVDWDVELAYLDISEFVSSVLRGNDFQAAINSQPAFVGQYPNMWNAFHSEGTSNFGKYSNAEVDALLETAVTATDPDEEFEAWQEVQVLLAEEIPFAIYGRPPSALITQPDVHGVDKYPDNTLWPATLWLD